MFEISDAAKRDIEAMDWVSGDIPTEGGAKREEERARERQESRKFGGWESKHRRKRKEKKREKEQKPREVTQTYSVRG
jgi:hypothetical protein